MGSYSALVCSIAQKWFDCKARFSLTTNGVVFNTEELGLVVPGDGGVGIDVTGEHGQLSGEILRLHVLFLSIESYYLRDIWLHNIFY